MMPSSAVLEHGHGLKMGGVHAAAIAAQVVDFVTGGDFTDEQSKRSSVGGAPYGGLNSLDRYVPTEHPVTADGVGGGPCPASIGAYFDLAQEALKTSHVHKRSRNVQG